MNIVLSAMHDYIIFLLTIFRENPVIQTYSNENDKLNTWLGSDFGFSNSLPEQPLKKAIAGKEHLHNICSEFKTLTEKDKLIDELVSMLKSEERYVEFVLLSLNIQ